MTSSSPVRVCVVDDDQRMQVALKAIIEGHPALHWVGGAANLADAYTLVDTQKPHLVLVDLGLPDGNGLELIAHIHSAHPECESMVFTVFGDESHVMASIEAGATGYLTKDTRPEDIVARLLQLHAGGSPISPVIARRLLSRFRALDTRPPLGTAPTTPRAAEDTPSAPLLSERELQVLEMVAKGFMQAEIAKLMEVSINTISTYVKRIYKKLAVNTRTGAVHKANELGLINLRDMQKDKS